MDTGHLDRVVAGVVAEDILAACEEGGGGGGPGGVGGTPTGDGGMANPAIHLLRGLRHRSVYFNRELIITYLSFTYFNLPIAPTVCRRNLISRLDEFFCN